MQTINLQFQVENDIYENFINNAQEIKEKIREFLFCELNKRDSYPSIGTEEAKRRVAQAVEEYRGGTGIYLSEQEYTIRMDTFMEELELKYGNN